MGQTRRSRARRRNAAGPHGRKRQAVLRHVYILPNLITTGSLFLGILAIVRVFEAALLDDPARMNKFVEACWLILGSGVLDMFDGLIARVTHTESRFGMNYDSLSDVIVFGVAPALLIMTVLKGDELPTANFATPFAILYIIFGAMRLARFNVQALGEESKTFTGLPIPGAAGTLLSSYLALRNMPDIASKVLPPLTGLLGILMVSKAVYPKATVMLMKKRKPFDYLIVVAVAVVFLWRIDPFEMTLMAGFLAYVAWGIGGWVWHRWHAARAPREAVETDANSSGAHTPGESEAPHP